MCNVNCCCNDVPNKRLRFFLYLFTLINLILSFIAIFIRAAKTERYKYALELLEERNRYKLSNYTLDKCDLGGYFKDDKYCEIDGKMLYKPRENVSFQSLFKNYVKVEVILNILRTIITGIFLVFLYFMFSKYSLEQLLEQQNIKNEIRDKFSGLLMISLIYLIILIFTSGLFILIRAFALTANQDIGLYEDGRQNEFESNTAINYIIDIINIILNGIAICFVLRIKRGLNQNQQNQYTIQQNNQLQPHRQIIPRNFPQHPSPSTDRINVNINIGQINMVQNNGSPNMNRPRQLPPINYQNNTPNPYRIQENALPSKDEIYG